MIKPVIIIGAGTLGVQALDIFIQNEVVVYCFLDDNESLYSTDIQGVSVLGKTDDSKFLSLLGKDCDVFVAIGETHIRKNITKKIQEDYQVMPINCIHSSAILSAFSSIGHGNFIGSAVSIASNVELGNHCILESKTSIEPFTEIGDYSVLSAGVTISSKVKVSENAFLGVGVSVVSGVMIEKNTRIGAGSVVVSNVEKGATYFGNPAKKV